jgi:ubiquinone/menaquinone biosynthesis C-methylase UbiE
VKCGHVGLQQAAAAWSCPTCSATFPIVDGVARFVSSEHYTGSFGYQWNTFARAQLDSANGTTRSRDTFVEKTGLTLDSLKGKRVLDAGCGMGRFAEVCIEAGAEVHAIDLSSAVEAAARNLGHHPNVSFYQADIMNLPFQDGMFDIVYSLGVLHHTPSTKQAFLKLSRLVKPGGTISIWVYSTETRLRFGSEILRMVTPRLPKPLLLKASKVAVPLYHVHRIPVVGWITQVLVPTSAGWTRSIGTRRGTSGSTPIRRCRAGSARPDSSRSNADRSPCRCAACVPRTPDPPACRPRFCS